MQSQLSFQQLTQTSTNNIQASIKKFETQVDQLANALNERKICQFPSQVVLNSKGTQEPKYVTTLRNGKVIGDKVNDAVHVDESEVIEDENMSKSMKMDTIIALKVAGQTQTTISHGYPSSFVKAYVPHIPYPGCLKANKYSNDILEQFKKVEINIPLLDAIKQIPSYAKFLKDLCTNKWKFKEYKKVMLSEEVSVVIQWKLPSKLRDLGSFIISCTIGKQTFEKGIT